VPHRIRELAILRIASLLQADVEWGQHFKIAQMVGVSIDEARAIRDGELSGFVPAERAAIDFATAVEQRSVDETAWAAAAKYYTQVQLLDLAMVAGFYGYASRVTLALGVEVDAGLSRIAES
jgi:alkylhydroperoxidase family enzyme